MNEKKKKWKRKEGRRNEGQIGEEAWNSQQPIHSNDESHVLCRESHHVQHHHHRYQTSLRDASRPDSCRCGRDAVGEGVAQ